MLEFCGVIRNSLEGQMPSASSGFSGWRRFPKPVLPSAPEGLNASKPAKLSDADELGEREQQRDRDAAISSGLAQRTRARSCIPSRRSRSRQATSSAHAIAARASQARPGEAVVVDRAGGDHPPGDREPGLSLQPLRPRSGSVEAIVGL